MEECRIVLINQGEKEFKDFENSKNKILVIDYSDNFNFIEEKESPLTQEKIKLYIKNNPFKGVKIIKSKDLNIKKNSIMIRILKNIKQIDIIELIKKPKTWIALWPILICFFYMWGYIFLYGFYFSGEINHSISISKIFINPVPFKLQSVAGIGFIYTIISILILLIAQKILKSKSFIDMMFYLALFFLVGIGISEIVKVFFIGLHDNFNKYQMLNFYGYIMLFPTIILIMVVLPFKLLEYKVKIIINSFLSVVTFIIATVFIIKTKLNFNISDYVLGFIIFLVIFAGTPITACVISGVMEYIEKKINANENKYKIIYKIIIWIPSIILFVIFIVALSNMNMSKVIWILGIIIFAISVVYMYKKKFKNISNKSKSVNKTKENYIVYIIVIFSALLLLYTIVVLPGLTVDIGKSIRKGILEENVDKIIYGTTDLNSNANMILGQVIAHSDGIYYISSFPEYKLITIKNTMVTTLPCKKLNLSTDIEEINKDIRVFIDNNIDNNLEKQIKVDPPTVDSKQSKLLCNIIRLSEKSQKDKNNMIYESRIQYRVDEYGEIQNFEIVFSLESYKEDTAINNCLREYETFLLEYLDLPKLDQNNQKYYYSNGVLKYQETIEKNYVIKKYTLEDFKIN